MFWGFLIYLPPMLRETYRQEESIEQEFRDRLNHGVEPAVADTLVRMLREDGPTFLHSLYISHYAGLMGRFAGMGEEDAKLLEREALVHDIGKAVPTVRSLLRRRHLGGTEWEEVQRHTLYGGEILRELGLPQYAEVAEEHHENFDGSGYPFGYCGDAERFGRAVITPHAQILRIVDSYYSAQLTYDKQRVLGPAEMKLMGQANGITAQHYAANQIMAGMGTRFNPALRPAFEMFFRDLKNRPDLFNIPSLDITYVDDAATPYLDIASSLLHPVPRGVIIKNDVRPSPH